MHLGNFGRFRCNLSSSFRLKVGVVLTQIQLNSPNPKTEADANLQQELIIELRLEHPKYITKVLQVLEMV